MYLKFDFFAIIYKCQREKLCALQFNYKSMHHINRVIFKLMKT